MASMTFSDLFGTYYSLYRGEDDPPAITDPEWTIAIRLYNNALLRMAAFDDTKWNFFYSTLQTTAGTGGITTLSTGVTSYACPNDMAEPGGQLIVDSTVNWPVIQPHEAQAQGVNTRYAYFNGDQQNGFTLHVNPAPTSTDNGKTLDYIYYKKPPLLTTSETGTTLVAPGDPAFYYSHMLANRWRPDENFNSYQTALRDAEESLKGMKLKNNSGSYYNPWSVQDLGSGFGDTNDNNWSFGN